MTTLFIVGVICALLLGGFAGFILGTGVVVNRIRDYRDTVNEPQYGDEAARTILNDLLRFLTNDLK